MLERRKPAGVTAMMKTRKISDAGVEERATDCL